MSTAQSDGTRRGPVRGNGHVASCPPLGPPAPGAPADRTAGHQPSVVLPQSEAHFRAMFGSAPLAISVTRGTDVIYANAAFLEMLGLSSLEELRGIPGLDRMAPEFRAEGLENMRRRAEGLPVPSTYETVYLRRDGSRVYAFLQVTTVVFDDGPATVAFITDITDRKRAEEKLREQDRQFRSFVEQAPVAISVSRDGVCLYSNQRVADLLGRDSPEELVGAPVCSFFLPGKRAECKERISLRSQSLPVPAEYESVLLRADGSEVPVRFDVGPVELYDGTANIAFVTDITERRRAERHLRASKALRDVSERVARAGSWRLDFGAQKESWSDGMLALFDVEPGDFGGDATPVMEKRVLAADLGPVLEARAIASETGEPLPLEFRVRHRDGTERVVHSEGTAEHDENGKVVAMTGYCQDVTDLRQAGLRLEAAAVEWSETFDAMNDAVALLDGEGRVVRCNAATLEVTGLYIDDIVGSRWDEIFDDGGVAGSTHQSAFGTEKARTKIIERGHKWLRLSCRPQLDASGQVKSGVLVVSDISPLHRAEQVAIERAHFLEQLLKAVPVPVYYTDASRHIVGYNQAYSTWFGLAQGERIGGTVYDAAPVALAERLDAMDKDLLTQPGGVVDFETELPGPAGTSRYTLGHKAVFSDVSGNTAGIVGVILDITEIRRVEQELASSAAMLGLTLEGAVSALGATTELRDPYTAGHQRRVAQFCTAMAAKLGWDEARTKLLDIAGRLHDIGKVVVPAEILAKPGRLSDAETQIIRQHSGAGAEIVGSIGFDPDVATMIRQHHERLDGSGYPDGLGGAEILPETLILSVADVVEAMISHRPYRPGLPIEAAVAELRAGAGLRYDARACEAAIALVSADGFKLGSSITF